MYHHFNGYYAVMIMSPFFSLCLTLRGMRDVHQNFEMKLFEKSDLDTINI